MNRRKRIVLFHPRTEHENNYRFFWIPYSIVSLVNPLRALGLDVQVIDHNLDPEAESFQELSGDTSDVIAVGISAMIGHQIRNGLKFAEEVRRTCPKATIIWGGPLPTLLPTETLAHPLVDVVVRGPGEGTIVTVIDALIHGAALGSIDGIGFKEMGRIHLTQPTSLTDLNQLAPYAFDSIRVSDYVRNDVNIATRTVNHHSSQGCPFSCGFCAEVPLWQRRWSGLTADRVIRDIEYLVREHDVNGIKFYDSEFFIDKSRVFKLARLLISRGTPVKWAASVHPKNVAKLSAVELAELAESGLSRLLIGAESGVQEEIDLVGKGTSRQMIVEIAKRLADVGIVGSFTFVTGYPGFPGEHVERSLEFGVELREVSTRHEVKVHFYGPYPGTPLYRYALDNGFDPPKSLVEWSYFDYYDITTPWVEERYVRRVRDFNVEHYPYLHPPVQDAGHAI